MTKPFLARSWLFAPGDSERKMAKACASAADIVLLDLEDSVAPENKATARKLVKEALAAQGDRTRIWVRINPLDSGIAPDDLAAIMAEGPGGILLPKANGRSDVERLDHYLTALEATHRIERGTTKVAALVTETAAAMFTTGDYAGAPRLVAMSWGAEDLSDALGASETTIADGQIEVANTRTLTSLRAACACWARWLPMCCRSKPFRRIFAIPTRWQRGPAPCGAQAIAGCWPFTRRRWTSSTRPSLPTSRKSRRRRKSLPCLRTIRGQEPSAIGARCSTAPIWRVRANCWRWRIGQRTDKTRFIFLH